jgi:3-hydroxyisobutyrate dehydrogenase-like beta-hydroxyacid dehydrogenase
MNVGFVGLGAMGSVMAVNLVRAGHTVQVWNRSPAPVRVLVDAGAEAAPDLDAVVRNEVVISMLADDTAVDALLLRPELLAAATAGGAQVHVNMATVSIALARRAAALHAEHGVGYVAAPVLGRPEAAAAAKLNILAAGEPKLVDRVAPLLDAMGQRTWRLGDEPHQANATKITINLMLACAVGTLAEACALAEANGVAPTDLVDVATSTLFAGAAYAGYGALVSQRRYEPAGFRLRHGLKDVNLALDAGSDAHVPLPLGSVLRDAFLDAVAHGDADRDWAAVAEVARRRAGLPT